MPYKQIVFAEVPLKEIELGKTFKVTEVETVPELKDGQILVKPSYFSFDPTQRVYISGRKSYRDPLAIGDLMLGRGIAEVVRSKNDRFSPGDLISGELTWSEYSVVDGSTVRSLPAIPGVPKQDFLGVLGSTGFTAWVGINKVIGGIKAGSRVVISGAAGATGSVAVQLAKFYGAHVIGIAGSDEKCNVVTSEFGADLALNYKSPSFKEDFVSATAEGIDVYFDNVGGEILDLALLCASLNARFIMCGAISGYNTGFEGIKNYPMITVKRLTLSGFIVTDYLDQITAFSKDMGTLLASGKVKSKSTVIKGDLTKAPELLRDLYRGINIGKLVLEIDQSTVSSLE